MTLANGWVGGLILCAYYVLGAGMIFLTSRFIRTPKEFIRKSYHVMCSISVFILLTVFRDWYLAALSIGVLCAIVLAVVPLASRHRFFRDVSVARQEKLGELLRQAVAFFAVLALLVTFYWGVLDLRVHIAVGIMAWGLGDSLAAIIGKRFGKHKLSFRYFDPKKTLEGSLAMAGGSFIGIFAAFAILGRVSIAFALISSCILAAVSATVEAIARKGVDTVMIPAAVSLVSLCLQTLSSLLLD